MARPMYKWNRSGNREMRGGFPVKRTTRSFWRGTRPLLFGTIASGIVAAYFLSPVPGRGTVFFQPGPEGTAMTRKSGDGTVRRSAEVPPIDASLPGVTETATFALG